MPTRHEKVVILHNGAHLPAPPAGLATAVDELIALAQEGDVSRIRARLKEIVPESIPELRYMPVLIGVLIGLALVAALVRRRGLLYLWTGLFSLLALVGLADFWKWGYDYGHNLDPTAAIRIPGMAYQPPLIGAKQLLNF